MNKPKILFFDIETMPLKAFVWQPGKQFVGHSNLLPSHEMWDLICIQYCWDNGDPVKVLRYDKHGGTKGMLQKFDKLIAKADVCIGKNSDRFDIKMLNSLRMHHGLPGNPDWHKYTDDLEKQMRKHFRLPSQSLDYISRLCGVGGKVSMSMKDWIAISNYRELTDLSGALGTKEINAVSKHLFKQKASEVKKEGKEALEKMCTYGAKDTDDTRILWHHLKEHFLPKFNVAKFIGEKIACVRCGSKNVHKNGTRYSGKTKYQKYQCNECHQYAGKAPIGLKNEPGQIG